MDAQHSSANFNFLASHNLQLVRLGALAERYFVDDAPGALIKLRQLAEFIAKDVAARQGVLPKVDVSFDDALRTLKIRAALPREIGEMFYHLKHVGNRAAHEDWGTPGDALTALKIARALAVWFHQTYQGAPNFKPGPFVPPSAPADASKALREEIERSARRSAQAPTRWPRHGCGNRRLRMNGSKLSLTARPPWRRRRASASSGKPTRPKLNRKAPAAPPRQSLSPHKMRRDRRPLQSSTRWRRWPLSPGHEDRAGRSHHPGPDRRSAPRGRLDGR